MPSEPCYCLRHPEAMPCEARALTTAWRCGSRGRRRNLNLPLITSRQAGVGWLGVGRFDLVLRRGRRKSRQSTSFADSMCSAFDRRGLWQRGGKEKKEIPRRWAEPAAQESQAEVFCLCMHHTRVPLLVFAMLTMLRVRSFPFRARISVNLW
uniref:Uncharacterized protein n=1 Tax=Physcomitrium patens TaxID=3218 RepID=A0A2K1L6Z0_PHYPA|nr:hypothetical protein PHYPA_000229 [Physcomitrium patens]